MIRWTGLAPWEFELPFSGSLTSTFLQRRGPVTFEPARATSPGTNPGTGIAYHPTALPTVGPYALPAPGDELGSLLYNVEAR